MNRRQFLQRSAALLTIPKLLARATELHCDVAVIGGGVGGFAAALAALRGGMRVILTEETDWIGGQLTAQAVPPDEHPWIEKFGCTRSYRDYRESVRGYYRRHYPLTKLAQARPDLNPGNGLVSRLTHEFRVSITVLEALLAPYSGSGQLLVLLEHVPESATTDGDRVTSVGVRDTSVGVSRTITAKYFLDATELGDLLPLTKTEFITGAESQAQTGEMHAAAVAQPKNSQAFTYCFAMDYVKGEDHTIERPADYHQWRPRLSWTFTDPQTLQPVTRLFAPNPDYTAPNSNGDNLWIYRRIADRTNFQPGRYPSDITLVNWPENDFWGGDLVTAPPHQRAPLLRRAKQLSLSFLYWMQTNGWKGLRLREATAEKFKDSVGVGSYRIDLHPSVGGTNYIDISSLPFQIPLGALIPKRMENLVAACKNIGTTHITNGCYRLHPVEWNIGEAAGALAAHAITIHQPPRAIRNNTKLREAFQTYLQMQGFELDRPHSWSGPPACHDGIRAGIMLA